jgi:hypothetical protein
MLPFVPVNSLWWRVQDATSHQLNMEIGWPELAAIVAHVRDSIPASDRTALGVVAEDEGEAGAVNLYGRAYGLPRAVSGMNSNWLRGYGDPPPQTVIAVGFKPDELNQIFASCQVAAQLSNPYGIVNDIFRDRDRVYSESGCDAWTLARIAGHSSVGISTRYVHPSEDTVLNAVEKLGGHNIGHSDESSVHKDASTKLLPS